MAHIIHMSVTNGIKGTPEVDNTIIKNRKIAQKFNKSYALKYRVEEEQKKRGLKVKPIIQDVPTRWGSTRASTQSFLDSKTEDKEKDKKDSLSDVFEDEFRNMEAINSALSKIKYKKGQKLSDYLLTRTEMNRIKHINKFLTTIDN